MGGEDDLPAMISRSISARLGASVAALLVFVVSAAGVSRGAGAASGPPTFDHPYLDGFSGPEPAVSVNLAGTWQFETKLVTTCAPTPPGIVFGPPEGCVDRPVAQRTTIQVPGGGWVKQGFANVSRAVYGRTIDVPDIGAPQVTKLVFGAVNHEATVSIDGRVVGTNTTAYLPSVFDLTPFVRPGASHVLAVDVKGRDALRDADGYYTVPVAADWSPDVAQGIFRSARLEVFSAVHVSDTFVRTSVKERTLVADVSVTNAGDTAQRVSLSARIVSSTGRAWRYPDLPRTDVTVPPRATTVVRLGPVAWELGSRSYWWPNVPYVAGYRTELHLLRLELTTPAAGVATSRAGYRFGFREIEQVGDHFELNGVRVNFRGDSLQGANYDGIDHGGKGDAYGTYPGFLAPDDVNPGWPRAVENYLRLNYSGVRIHQVPATPYMLDVADEMGLMILDETAIRGSNGRQSFATGRDNMVSHLRALVLRDRNHASVLRWSQSNEPSSVSGTPGWSADFDATLYRTIMEIDDTRPISTDVAFPIVDLPFPNYTVWCHYYGNGGPFAFEYTDDSCKDAPGKLPGKPYGQGELFLFASKQEFTWFATVTHQLRVKGASDIRPYTLLENWASFVPGVRTFDLLREFGGRPLYGEDNLSDPWANPQVQRVQNAFSPVLVADKEYWEASKLSNADGDWPAEPVVLPRGRRITRVLQVFNDTFFGNRVRVRWELRQGAPDGALVAGSTMDVAVPLGTHVERRISFVPPRTPDPLYLVLSATKSSRCELGLAPAARPRLPGLDGAGVTQGANDDALADVSAHTDERTAPTSGDLCVLFRDAATRFD